ncbi:MAG: hypothetical protein J6S13_08675 [Clostridia bacterium]|nr:hypothetical protein [Clostridia bacterium]
MLFTVVAVVMISAVMILLVKKYSPEYALVVSIVAGGTVLIFLVVALKEILGSIADIFDKSGLDKGVFKLVLKALGLCYLSEFASDVCRDFGQTSLAAKVELAGKISIIALTFPLIGQILTAVTELIG